MAAGKKRALGGKPAFSAYNKKQQTASIVPDEDDFENSEDVAELQRLVMEAQRSRPKDAAKIKVSQSSLHGKKSTAAAAASESEEEDEEDEDAAAEDEDELDEEARVLLEMKREREALENEEEVEDEDEDLDLSQFAAPVVNDAPQMRQLATELTIPSFIESLCIVQEEEEEPVKINPEDDKERETRFQQIAMLAVDQGREAFAKLSIPFYRPHDFMAEMIKSDDHMARVKRRIIFEQEKIRAVEARKAASRNRNRKKEVKKQRTGEKATQKRKASELSSSFREKNKDFKKRDFKKGGSGGGFKKGGSSSGGGGNRLGKNKRKSAKGQKH